MFFKGLKDSFKFLAYWPKFIYTIYKLSRLQQPIISIFGGKRVERDSSEYHHAQELAQLLVQQNASILTGGGPGIMEAALCGTLLNGKQYGLGIGVKGVDIAYVPSCNQRTIFMNNFAMRKWLLIQYSVGFIIFPGGYGTVDELMEVLNLIKTKRMKPVPIVLFGKDFWQPFVDWIDAKLIKNKLVPEKYSNLLVITDDIHEASKLVRSK